MSLNELDILDFLPKNGLYVVNESIYDMNIISVYQYAGWEEAAKHFASELLEYELVEKFGEYKKIGNEFDTDWCLWRYSQLVPNNFEEKVKKEIQLLDSQDESYEVKKIKIAELLSYIPQKDGYVFYFRSNEGPYEQFYSGNIGDVVSELETMCGRRQTEFTCNLVKNSIVRKCGKFKFQSEEIAKEVFSKLPSKYVN